MKNGTRTGEAAIANGSTMSPPKIYAGLIMQNMQ
jgi:hypothetical protein